MHGLYVCEKLHFRLNAPDKNYYSIRTYVHILNLIGMKLVLQKHAHLTISKAV